MSTIPVGNTHRRETMDETLRTSEQLAVVKVIIAAPEFDFACGNPFAPDTFNEMNGYTGPFMFLYYTTDGVLRSRYIGKRGNILRSFDDGKEVTK